MKVCASWSACSIAACALLLDLRQYGWASATPLNEQNTAMKSSGSISTVSKTVFSDKLRLVFLVGLEGAGHHYITDTAKGIFRNNPSLIGGERMFVNGGLFFLPVVMTKSSARFDSAAGKARSEMKSLAQRGEELPPPGTFKILKGRSFPYGHGLQRVLQYPDPRLTAEAAEAGGVDLRVLYLRRSARELILADTVHRHFQDPTGKRRDPSESPGAPSPEERFMENLQVMFTDAAVVHSFLAELDPAFVVCHDWHLFGDPDQAQTIADFIAPGPEVASMIKTALVGSASGGVRHKGNETLPFDRDDILSSRLQQKLDSFEHLYCGRKINGRGR